MRALPEPAPAPARRPAPGGADRLLPALPLVSLLAGLLGWELVSRLELVDPLALPPLSDTLRRLATDLADDRLLTDLWASAQPLAIGLLLSILLGCALGALMGRSLIGDRLLSPWMLGLNAVPRIAFVSVFIVVFGLGVLGKVAVVVATAVIPMVLTIRSGVRAVDPALLEMGRAFRAPRALVLRRIVLPSTLPYFVAGFRITLALALIGEIVAEFFSASAGIGYRLQNASQTYDITEVYAMVVLLALVGIALAQAVAFLERRVARWQGGIGV